MNNRPRDNFFLDSLLAFVLLETKLGLSANCPWDEMENHISFGAI